MADFQICISVPLKFELTKSALEKENNGTEENITSSSEYLPDSWHLSGALIVNFTLSLHPFFGGFDSLVHLFASLEKVFTPSLKFSVAGLSVMAGERQNLPKLLLL